MKKILSVGVPDNGFYCKVHWDSASKRDLADLKKAIAKLQSIAGRARLSRVL